MLTRQQEFARQMAVNYRAKGWNPIPSCIDQKKPMFKYAHLWEELAPAEWFTPEGWPETTNLQVMCGARWNLLVIDLDGAEAIERWHRRGPHAPTWVVTRAGGTSQHWWYRSPADWKGPIKKRVLWKGVGPHQAIELLGDRSLVVAPPSYHVSDAGSQYIFLDKRHSPAKMAGPAEAPGWLMRMPGITPERPVLPAPHIAVRRDPLPGGVLDRNAVLESVPDKVGLARRFNLRTVGSPRQSGWQECYAIGREDTKPSAAINIHSGVYVDKGTGLRLPFPDLIACLAGFADWREALQEIARYGR